MHFAEHQLPAVSLFCAISGQPPLHPVVSIKSGQVYERTLVLKYLNDNDGRDPITGEQLKEEDLVDIKTAPGAPSAPPRAPTFTSVPALLHTLQSEWDATMLECLELRRAGEELRQELSHALYKEDAAMRVLARLTRERDEARQALASVKATLGPAFSNGAAANDDVDMSAAQNEPEAGLPADAKARVEETNKSLSAVRKKRKPAADTASKEAIKAYTQTTAIPSLHTTKPAGLSALALAKNASLIVTGGFDKNIQIYDRTSSKIVTTLKGHTKKVTAVIAADELNENGFPVVLVSASLDKSIRVWTRNGNKSVYACQANLSLGAEVNAISLHSSQTLVASAAADGSWAIHDLRADKPKTILTGNLESEGIGNSAIAFHPDGAIFAVGSTDSQIRVFDTITGKQIAEFEGHAAGQITSLAFSENGYTLASSAEKSNQVKIWDLRKLTNSATIELEAENTVTSLAFDQSAQYLAIAGTDLRVVANKTWEILVKSEENSAELTAVAWAPLAKELATSSVDRTVRFIGTPGE